MNFQGPKKDLTSCSITYPDAKGPLAKVTPEFSTRFWSLRETQDFSHHTHVHTHRHRYEHGYSGAFVLHQKGFFSSKRGGSNIKIA
jgi:hypothetical protein